MKKNKFLQIIMLIFLSHLIMSMEDTELNVEEPDAQEIEEIDSGEIQKQYACMLDIFKELDINTNKQDRPILRCYRCRQALLFQNDFSLLDDLEHKPILCSQCNKQ